MPSRLVIQVIFLMYVYALELMSKKNRDYASSQDALANLRLVERIGITDTATGILVRMSDKMARLKNLIHQDAAVQDETIADTIVDLINYAALLYAYLVEQGKVMPLEPENLETFLKTYADQALMKEKMSYAK